MSWQQELLSLVEQLAVQLTASKQQLIAVESCTGGMISAACTDMAGSSRWFYGGVVSYSNAAKEAYLKVRPQTLVQYGAVSEATVREMCAGALLQPVDVAVAVSGIAGPEGGSEEKPVGTVYIGWQCKGQPVSVERFCFAGNRNDIRRQAVLAAFIGLLELTQVEVTQK